MTDTDVSLATFLCRLVISFLSCSAANELFQPNTFLKNDEVILKEYPLTSAGAIESFIERQL